jgi:hypothetical protein
MKKLFHLLFFMFLTLSMMNCSQVGEEAAPVAQKQTFTEAELMQLIGHDEFKSDDFSRSRASRSLADVLDPINGEVVGKSLLIRTQNGLTMALKTHLVPKHTSTVWFVLFNNPENCDYCPCGGPNFEDFFNGEETGLVMINAAGRVNSQTGVTEFAGHLLEGDTRGSANEVVFGQPARALVDSRTAEVFLVVRSHGPAIPGEIREQTSIWEGGCTDFLLPFTEIPDEVGECADIQVSMHVLRDCP